ncbi:MarR family winged helix-turn-helix transcriptional regulator [Caldanaerobius polysaccharolyticus]|uniref:MarR family winged helix-turn-helix transcriptional regulator n=1 Tax=Caldanaerobius polysaccharolyticus TaxID=44256 RepID=UPI0004793849|nr:MarR family transcriptional regulator [Caldanaerobius polysaccharolyticus]
MQDIQEELRDMFLFFPIRLHRFINYIFSFLDEGFSKDLGVLMVLDKYGPMPISRIGNIISVRKSNMTPIIDYLEDLGYVKRNLSSEDRRKIYIEITDEGKMYLENKLDVIDKLIKEKCSNLNDEEIREAIEAVKTITCLIEKIVGPSLHH